MYLKNKNRRGAKKRALSFSILTLIALTLSACGASSDTQKITITGSSTVAPLAMELALAFEKSHPDVRIDVQTGGSSRGMADARASLADIGMMSRGLKRSENDLTPHTIAYDGIAIILNSSNPVSSLSDQQVVDIYKGNIDNWQTLGGPDQAITVVNKAEGRSTLELFLEYFQIDNRAIKADIIIGDNQQGIKTVAGNDWAISYVSIGAAEYEEQHGVPIKLLGVDGVNASTAAVKKGNYPLSRPLNFVTTKESQGAVKEFILFAQSAQAFDLVERQFFIPINAN